jgi:hypothetical protein
MISTDDLLIDPLLYPVAFRDIMESQFHRIYMLPTTDILDR